ncbi:signal transduction histidine kinase [Krasilnikovia cinnamomea]|uniref:histidine kinase n=1 Tax=Krasilnikovia cinnamomea TaxID=349313 RepID=A0A4Q7ZSN3_9ACTN|nr:histidine kinase [Krasilnikovia cinnamomea]RZU54212.1 signal transduction histidine kinase [Krasilnikovia cinnamomea]
MTKIWLLPAALCVGQLALWPGRAVGSVAAVAVTATVVLVAAALGLRRTRPVTAAVVVAAGLTLATWVAPADQQLLVPGDALLVISVADLVALFSVAARRDARTTALVLSGLLVWQAGLVAWQDGLTGDYPLALVTLIVVYGMVAAFGRIRGRWSGERAAAARRLAQARQAHRDAADAERRRLARELHDVTAHHLTSIVVNASAARLLEEQRPELRAEALDFAARTGHDTLTALRQLVAIMPAPPREADPAVGRLADLADDFRQLGQVVSVEVATDPPPALAAAVHGITREALTNTLRYAPGGAVRIAFSYGDGQAELVVDDDGGGGHGTGAAAGLGGGRGVHGMRERARALGGTLDAGPRDGGGWRVRAVFPLAVTGPATAGTPRSGARWRRVWSWVGRRLRSQTVLDAGIVLLVLVLPLTGLLTTVEEEGLSPAAATLALLALLAHSVPLLWRRSRPWWVLGAVAATTWLGPLLAVTGVMSADGAWWSLFGGGAELAAVYAVAAWGARPGLTWLAPIGGAAVLALAVGVLAAVSSTPELAADPDIPKQAVGFTAVMSQILITALFGALYVLPMGACWLAGWAARRRRSQRHAREEGGVAAAMAQAQMRAYDERARIAAGLRDAVLRHAAEVPRAAERADLDAVVGSARQALTAMRGLLDGLGRAGAAQQHEEVASSRSA